MNRINSPQHISQQLQMQMVAGIAAHSPNAILVVDVSTKKFLLFNDSTFRMLGYSREEFSGMTLYDLMFNRTHAELDTHFVELIAAGGGDFETEHLRKDGSICYIWVSSRVQKFEGRTCIGGVWNNITDLKLAKLDLMDDRRRLAERVKEQSCLYDIFAMTEDENRPQDDLLQEVAERLPAAWQFPDICEARLLLNDQTYSTKGFVDTRWLLTNTGQTRDKRLLRIDVAYMQEPSTGAGELFLQEEQELLENVVRRITDMLNRRAASVALEEHNQLIATMFSQTTDSILLVDIHTGDFVDFNTAAHINLGYSREEFVCLKVTDIQAEHSWEQIEENTLNAAIGEMIDIETRHRCKDGTFRDVILTLRPVVLGGRTLLSAVWRDITDHKSSLLAQAAAVGRLRLHNNLLAGLNISPAALNGNFDALANSLFSVFLLQ